VSKRQYESGASSKRSEKSQNSLEFNKVCHDFPPSFWSVHDVSLSQPKRDKFSGLTRRAKRRKMTMEEDKTDQRAIGASIRSAKQSMRPTKIGMPEPRSQKVKPKKTRGGPKKQNPLDRDLGQNLKTKTEGTRAKKGDSVGRAGKRSRKSR
jgi:ATP-dependent RNA helicase DDX27